MILNKKLDKDKVFFTSDTHFFHKNIIKYCNRPFESVEEMNEALKVLWNEKCPPDSIIFHLGDVSLTAGPAELRSLLFELNGTIHLIKGNHEKDVLKNLEVSKRFTKIDDILEIYIEDEEIDYKNQHIVLCHFPFYNGSWHSAHRGSWNLFGHVHGALTDNPLLGKCQLDVGVDPNKFVPLSYQEVKEMITNKNIHNAK